MPNIVTVGIKSMSYFISKYPTTWFWEYHKHRRQQNDLAFKQLKARRLCNRKK